MREIKFRVWAIASQVMFYPNSDDGWEIVKGKLNPLPNTILMQYTGLKDKNGKEIYEGDIVKQKGCMFCKSEPEYIEVSYDEFSCMGLEGIGFTFWENAPGSLEIIGNIYENKDLLK